jgi:predicted nucleotidyltransferase
MHAFVQAKLSAVVELCRQHRAVQLFLFGSALTEAFEPSRSDLDFLVVFADMTPREHARAYFGLKHALEDLYGRPADLVESRAITNPYFRRSVDSSRLLLYAA